MLELICLIAVMAFIAFKLQPHHFEKARDDWGLNQRAAASATVLAAARVAPKLAIAGTEQPASGSRGFVKSFGLDPASVKDLRVFRGDAFGSLPAALSAMVSELHARGSAVGGEIMALIHHGRALAQSEAIYFALVQPAEQAEPRVVAFVDRVR